MVLLGAVPALAAWLGIGVREITPDRMTALKLKEERGVEITTVMANSPAAEAGLKAQDVVLEYNGTRVDSVAQFQRMVRETPTGRTVKLLISRDGNTQTLNAKLGDRYRGPGGREEDIIREFTVRVPRFEMPEMPEMPQILTLSRSSRLGIDGEDLSKQLGEYFGAPNGEGVLVRSVQSGGAAEKAGIKAGDVIIKLGTQRVSNLRDLRSALRENTDKASVPVTVIRNKKEMTLTVSLERRDQGRDVIIRRGEYI